MNARCSRKAVQSCIEEGVRELITTMGGVPTAAEDLGIHAGTVRRKLIGEQAWSHIELAALISYELQEKGHSSIIETLVALTQSKPAEPIALLSDVTEDIGALAEEIALENAIRQHNGKDLTEIMRLHDMATKEITRQQRIRDDAFAFLESKGQTS